MDRRFDFLPCASAFGSTAQSERFGDLLCLRKVDRNRVLPETTRLSTCEGRLGESREISLFTNRLVAGCVGSGEQMLRPEVRS